MWNRHKYMGNVYGCDTCTKTCDGIRSYMRRIINNGLWGTIVCASICNIHNHTIIVIRNTDARYLVGIIHLENVATEIRYLHVSNDTRLINVTISHGGMNDQTGGII